jgi:ribosome maturation factor RimP
MTLNEKIANLARQALLGDNQFLPEVMVSSKHGPKKVTVVLDGDTGVTIEDCASVSRRLLKMIEDEKLMEEEGFSLEVTTPGLDHPLKLKRQYVKNIGRALKVQLHDKRTEHGTLTGVTDETIVLQQDVREGKKTEKKQNSFPFSEIERAIVQVSFK